MPTKTSEPSAADRPTVFLSYSRKDQKWLGELRTMLAPMVHDRLVQVWWDGDIKPSHQWREEIDEALSSAGIGVLLVSPNFLASDFIRQKELPYLVEAARERRVALFWILLSPCLYEYTPLAEIQAAHELSRSIRKLRPAERDAVLKAVCLKIAAEAKGRSVYRRRIQRDDEFFSTNKLGALGSELSALSGFFDRLWDQPLASLTSADQAFLLNEVGFNLRSLGRLAEAVQPTEAGLRQYEDQEDWQNAATAAGNLSELTLTLGEVERAVAFGKQSVELADRSGDAFQRMVDRTVLADALHQAGHWEKSAETFREAEALQAEDQPEYPQLYSVPGYQYCDLLLSHGEPEGGSVVDGLATAPEAARRLREACQEVRERAEQAITVAESNYWLLDIALDHLSLGRAHLGLALTVPRSATPEEAETDLAKAAKHLDNAVEGLRRAGEEEFVARGLLARAAFQRFRSDLPAAEADLSARARKLVEDTGYGRRRREVEWLERQLSAT